MIEIEIGIDIGQGGVRAIRPDSGQAVDDPRGYWDAPVSELVLAAVRHLVPPGPISLGVGTTGPADVAPDVADVLRGAGYTGRLAVASDAVTTFLGARGTADGVVVAVGTGAVVLGSGPLGVAVVDGLGHELGDRGSGYGIGRASVRRALALAEGGEEDPLVAAVIARFGAIDGFTQRWRAAPPDVREVAGFAADVAALARAGSAAAAEIWRRAGADLAASATTAIRRCGSDTVALAGGLAAAGELLAAPLRAGLPPGARLVAAAGGSRDGAVALARSESTAFESLVSRVALS